MGKALRLICASLACLSLTAACSVRDKGPLPSDPRSIWCDHNSPRRDARSDTPRSELDEINKHNFQGAKWCGWKPSEGSGH
ncbi:hypothetical protein C1M53_27750 [Mesorhizobium sp. Pch-S]|nr:hypothetical protein C1M53_27750 [Mesorhizobium sp. Pch-S]